MDGCGSERGHTPRKAVSLVDRLKMAREAGFSRARDTFTDIGQGDLRWADVRKALQVVGFTGWFTAEVKGGGLKRLQAVRRQMAEVLGLV